MHTIGAAGLLYHAAPSTVMVYMPVAVKAAANDGAIASAGDAGTDRVVTAAADKTTTEKSNSIAADR